MSGYLSYLNRAASGLSHLVAEADKRTVCGRDVYDDEATVDFPSYVVCAECKAVSS